MKKKLIAFCFCSFVLSTITTLKAQQNTENTRFSGIIGNPSSVFSHHKISPIDQAEFISKCTFFGGDSLDGFDFQLSSIKFPITNPAHLFEYQNYFRMQQKAFVKNKFAIQETRYDKRSIVLSENDESSSRSSSKLNSATSINGSSCNNVDFEDGDLNGWSRLVGYNDNSNNDLILTSGSGTLGFDSDFDSCDDYAILTSSLADDPIGGFPVVDPTDGGTYSLRIGSYNKNSSSSKCTHRSSVGADGEILRKTITVTNTNALLFFRYAVVLSDATTGGVIHGDSAMPYFQVKVKPSGSGTTSVCGNYYVQVPTGHAPPGFSTTTYLGEYIYYRRWTSSILNLAPYIGQTVTIDFIAAGCIFGAHPGYAYIDGVCKPADVSETKQCLKSTFTAPLVEDATYSWTGPAGGIVGSSTSQTITVQTNGTYEVTITPQQGNSCSFKLTKTFTIPGGVISSSSTKSDVSCYGFTNGSITVSASSPAAGGLTYAWSPSGISSSNNQAYNLSAGSYTCTISDVNNCQKTEVVSITQPPSALSLISTNITQVNCYGQNSGAITMAASGGTPGYSYTWNPTIGSGATVTNLPAGTYTCTVRDFKSCVETKTITITQPSSAVALNISNQQNINCYGESTGSISMSANGGTPSYTYSWSPANSPNSSINNIPAGTYTCTLKDFNGCTVVKTITITQPQSPLTTSTSNVNNISCYGLANGSISINSNGGTPGYTYTWTPNIGTGSSYTNLSPGTYQCVVKDIKGCSSTQNITLTQPSAALSSSINTQKNVDCFGKQNGSITLLTKGGTPGYTYAWTPNVGINGSVSNLPAGTYACTITDAKGCVTNITSTISQPSAALTASIGSQQNVKCYGDFSGHATLVVNGGTPGYSYNWSPPISTGNAISNVSAGAYFCEIIDKNGCKDTQTVNILQASSLVMNLAQQQNVDCKGQTTGSIQMHANGGTPPYTYTWNPNAGNGPLISNLSAGSYTCTVKDAEGCLFFKSATITEPANPLTISINNLQHVPCFGDSKGSVVLDIMGGTPGYTYNWSPNISSGNSALNLSAGTYTCTITDNKGCTSTKTVTINQPSSALGVNIISQQQVNCFGTATGAVNLNGEGGTPGYNYSWNPNVSNTGNAQYLNAGTYTCTITDNNGCKYIKTITVTQPAAALTASLSASQDVKCHGESTGSAVLMTSGGTPFYTYNWIPAVSTTNLLHNVPAGTYTCNVQDANGCGSMVNVTIHQPNVLQLKLDADVVCATHKNTVTAQVNGGTAPFQYNWSPAAGNGSSISAVGSQFSVTVIDANNCKINQSITAQNNPLPNIQFSDNTNNGVLEINGDKGLICFTDQTADAVSWNWNFNSLLNSVNINPCFSVNNGGDYCVQLNVTNKYGCIDSVNKCYTIKIINADFPNIFTPNDDASNNTFQIPSKGYSDMSCIIYNRWGLKVYEWFGLGGSWDGNLFNGEKAASGTYFWVAVLQEADGKKLVKQGTVLLTR